MILSRILAYALAASLIANVLFWGLWQHADNRRLKLANDLGQKAVKAQIDAREAERRHVEAMAVIAEQHERDKKDAEERADRAYRAVLADNGRLRQHWQGCRATSEAIAGLAEPDGHDRLRAESLRRVLEWVGLLQAQRDGLQEVVRQDRK